MESVVLAGRALLSNLRYHSCIRVGQCDGQPLLFRKPDGHARAAADRPVIVIDRQQAVRPVHHILVAPPVIHCRGRVLLPDYDDLCTVADEKSHTPAVMFDPALIVPLKGQSDHQLYLTILELFLQPQQYLSGPHVHPQSAAYPELAEVLLVEICLWDLARIILIAFIIQIVEAIRFFVAKTLPCVLD